MAHAELVEAKASASHPLAQLDAMGCAYLRFARHNPERYPLIFSRGLGDDAELTDAVTAASELFVGAVAAAIEPGTLPADDPRELAATVLATAHGGQLTSPAPVTSRRTSGAPTPRACSRCSSERSAERLAERDRVVVLLAARDAPAAGDHAHPLGTGMRARCRPSHSSPPSARARGCRRSGR